MNPVGFNKTLYLFFCSLLLACFSTGVRAQTNTLTIGSNDLNSKAVLWLVPNGGQGLLLPSLPTATRTGMSLQSTDKGMIVFDSGDNKLYFWDGTNWTGLANSSNTPVNLIGDVSGTSAATVVGALQGNKVSTSVPADKQVLKWNDTSKQWEPSAEAANTLLAGTGITVTGNTVSVSNDGITTTQILNGTVGNADLASNSVDDSKVTSVAPGKLTAAGASSGQVLKWNGTAWAPAADAGGTTYTAGTGIIITGSQLSVNVGTTANKIVQLDVNGKLPAVDGSQLTNLPSGSITAVTAGTGLTGGATSGNATLNVNTGTGANQIVQLDATSKLPAVDASQLTNLDAGKINTGTLPVTRGGTGATTVTQGGVAYGTASNFAFTSSGTTGQLLQSNGTSAPAWVNAPGATGTAGGDLAGTYPNPNVVKIQGKSISATAPTAGQVLQFVSGSWTPQNLTGGGTVTTVSGTAPITVTNGSTTPSIVLANTAVTPNTYGTASSVGQFTVDAQGRITGATSLAIPTATTTTAGLLTASDWNTFNSKLSSIPVLGGDISGSLTNVSVDKIQGTDVSATTPTTNQVLQYNGTNWVPSTLSTGGTVTNIITGTGLTGGPISASGTIAIAAGGVTSTELASGAVTNTTIAANAINSSQIIDGSITNADINSAAAIAVTKIAAGSNGQVLTVNAGAPSWQTPSASGTAGGDLTGSYPNPTINAGAVTSTKIASGAVATINIAAGAVNDTKISAVAPGKITQAGATTGQVLKWDGTAWSAGSDDVGSGGAPTLLSGQIIIGNGSSNTGATLTGDGSLNGGVITINGLQGRPISSSVPATNSVYQFDGTNWNPVVLSGGGTVSSITTGTGLTGGPITSAGTISISPAGVTSTELATGAVTTNKIASGAVTTTEISDGTITDTDISSAAAIDVTKLAAGTNGQVLTVNAGVPSWQTTSGLTNPMTAAGDMIVGIAGGTPNNLPIGSSGQVLTVSGGAPVWQAAPGPTGTASGDLSGTYPSPTIGSSATVGNHIITAANASSSSINGARVNPSFGSQNVSTSGTLAAGAATVTGLTVSGASTTLNTVGYSWPAGQGGSGTVLTNNGSGALTWTTPASIPTLGGDISGTLSAVSVDKLKGSSISATAPTAGQVLQFVSGAWTPQNLSGGGTVTNVTASTPLSSTGGATPDISFNNQTANTILAAPDGSTGAPAFRALTANDIPALDVSKITTGTLPVTAGGTGASTAAGALTNLGALGTTLNSGQVLVGNASNVATGVSLNGDIATTSATGVVTIANNAITSAKISDGTIVNADVNATAAIDGTKINPAFGGQSISTTGTLSGGATTVTGLTVSGTSTTLNTVGYTWPGTQGGAGTVLTNNGSGTLAWSAAGGTGTVTNVGLAMPTIFTVSNSPVTTTGTLTAALASQAANTLLIAPNGSAGAPTFRILATADVPNLDAAKITTGTLPIARGGTNSTATATNGGVSYGTGTAYAFTAAGTSGQLLQSGGAGAPSWITPSYMTNPFTTLGDIVYGNGTIPTRLAGAAGFLKSTGAAAPAWSAVNLASTDVTGTLTIAKGGTNSTTTPTNGGITYGTGTALAYTAVGTSGQILMSNGAAAPSWTAMPTGTVSSVALSLPAMFSVTGSPITTSGTLAATLASETANTILAAPNGSAGAPTFRTLAAADIPALDASKITTGTLPLTLGGTGATTAAAARTSLGLGTMAVAANPLTTNGDIIYAVGTTPTRLAGAAGFLKSTGAATPAWSAVNLASTDVTGTLPIAQGGTNSTATATNGGVGYGTGTAHAYTTAGTTGQVLTSNGAAAPSWTTPAAGSVTSVALSMPSIFAVSGSPVSSSGTLTATLASEAANTILAAPNGSAGAPTFRILAAADIPVIDASKISTGTLPIARGGTNSVATATSGGISYGTGTAYGFTAAGTTGQLLQSNGAAAPTWINAPAVVTASNGLTMTSNNVTLGGALTANTTIANGAFNLNLTGTGKLGLATSATPLATLDVRGNSIITGTNTNTPLAPVSALELMTGRTSAGALNSGQTVADISLQYGGSGGGFRHFIQSRHNGVASSNLNAIDFYLNNSTTAAGSTGPATGNVLGMSVTATGVAVASTLAPSNKLDVGGNIAIGASYVGSSTAPVDGMIIQGNVGIGTTTPGAYPLSVVGNVKATGSIALGASGETISATASNELVFSGYLNPNVNNSYQIGQSGKMWSTIYATNGSINTSDVRLKKNIKNLNYGLADLLKLRPVSYDWKDGSNKKAKLGLIAQEAEVIIPEVVDTPKTKEEYYGITYTDLVPVLIKATQELNAKIEALEKENTELKGTNTKLQSQVSTLQEKQDSELAAIKKQMEEVKKMLGMEAKKK